MAILFRLIVTSFLNKSALEKHVKPNVYYNDYIELLDTIWDSLVERAYSFIVKDENNRMIGVTLNFDAHDELKASLVGGLKVIFDFVEFLEGPVKYINLDR